MKKSKKIVLVVIALVVVLMSFVGGQVYAKYMSKVQGQGTAEVANWNFKVNDKEEQIQTIHLNSTINNNTLVNNKIAPGTQGSFQIKLDATDAEVGIDYVIRFENESNKPTNLKYEYENKNYTSLNELQKDLTGTINANDSNKTKIITINWSWPYETGTTAEQIAANDKIDTQNAKSIRNYTFNIVVTGTQVKPIN